jgi:hypothetical protein
MRAHMTNLVSLSLEHDVVVLCSLVHFHTLPPTNPAREDVSGRPIYFHHDMMSHYRRI